jgi:hypothetical protein
MWKREALRLAQSVVVVLVILILAGAVVEIINHVGIVSGLGLRDEIARSVADASTFGLTGALLYLAWHGER